MTSIHVIPAVCPFMAPFFPDTWNVFVYCLLLFLCSVVVGVGAKFKVREGRRAWVDGYDGYLNAQGGGGG